MAFSTKRICALLFVLVTPILCEEAFSSRSLGTNCDSSYSATCLKLDIVNLVEKFSGRSSDIDIFPGLSLVKDQDVSSTESSEKVAELARSFPNDPDQRVDEYLLFKIGSFLNSHSLKFKLMDEETSEEMGREFRKGGGLGSILKKKKKGGKKGMGAIMMLAMMLKGMLGALAFKGIFLLAGKALLTALIALLLSGIVGLKSLAGGEKTATYEIVSKPAYAEHPVGHEDIHGGGGYGHGGYARSIDIKLPEHLSKPLP